MNIWLSFPYNSFKSTSEAFKFICKFILFPIEGILSPDDERRYIEFDMKKIVKYIDEKQLDNFTIINRYDEYLDFKNDIVFRREILKKLNVFCFSLESESNIKLNDLIDESYERDFTTMILFDDYSKIKWQNEEIIFNYITFKRPYEHLPKIWDEVLSPIYGEVIDISKNPGHMKETYSMVLMAAPEIWFGPGCWEYFDKDLILSFPDAIEIKEIKKDLVYVKLFDWKVPDYEDEKILSIQKKFREYTKMNEIEEKLNKKVEKPKGVVINKIYLGKTNKNKDN